MSDNPILWVEYPHAPGKLETPSRADVLAALGYEEGEPWCWVHHSGVSNLAPGYGKCDRFGRNERPCQFRPLLVPVEDADGVD